jgi:hypothetical protein
MDSSLTLSSMPSSFKREARNAPTDSIFGIYTSGTELGEMYDGQWARGKRRWERPLKITFFITEPIASRLIYTALTTFLDRIHLVHTCVLFVPRSVTIFIRWILGIKTRFVLLFAWLTLFPTALFFPQIEQLAILCTSFDCIKKSFMITFQE